MKDKNVLFALTGICSIVCSDNQICKILKLYVRYYAIHENVHSHMKSVSVLAKV